MEEGPIQGYVSGWVSFSPLQFLQSSAVSLSSWLLYKLSLHSAHTLGRGLLSSMEACLVTL